MPWNAKHLSDRALLMLDDDDTAAWDRARAHLARCRSCAARLDTIRTTLQELTAAARQAEGEPPSAAQARLALMATLDRLARAERTAGWRRPAYPGAAAAAVVVVAVIVAMLTSPADEPAGVRGPSRDETPAAGRYLPRPDLTPGAVRPVSATDVCREDPGSIAALIPASLPRQVFDAYRIDYARAADYELDFLITPELGGAPEARNLWPQPYRSATWNAFVKDELERHLHQLVCRGALDIAHAQREMATNWIDAYQRYFETDRPRRDYHRFPITRDDADAWRSEVAERRLLPPASLVRARVVTSWLVIRRELPVRVVVQQRGVVPQLDRRSGRAALALDPERGG